MLIILILPKVIKQKTNLSTRLKFCNKLTKNFDTLMS